MLITIGILSLLLVAGSIKFLRIKNERNYLDQMACVEQNRAQIATELLYEGHAKHRDLSLEDTMGLIESIRQEANPIARTAMADRIITGEKSESRKKIGF